MSETETKVPLENTTEPTPAPEPTAEKKESSFSELLRFAVIAIIIVLPVRMFIAQPFIVSGASMLDTFHDKDYLIVDQLSYHLGTPERGDVVVFRYPKDPSKYFIKRVIGIPGDTIDVNGDEVTITNDQHPDGTTVTESYVYSMEEASYVTETLGDKEYFVMGDNRDASSDSRVWGVLHEDNIIGQAFLRLFPVTDIGVLPGAFAEEQMLITTTN